MLSKISRYIVAALFIASCGGMVEAQPSGQSPQEVTIKLKLFDSNQPTTELIPSNVIITLRNPADNQPQYLPNVRIEQIPEQKGFYRVKLPKGRLVERMVIQVDSASGTNFNPGVVTKVVTAADMTVYPGASDPGDKFAFQSYIGQLEVYRSIFDDLIATFGDSQDKVIRAQLKSAFEPQLHKMADAEHSGRLTGFSEEQLKTAREKTKSILVLYGILPEDKAAPLVVYAPDCAHTNYAPFRICNPPPTRRIFSRNR